MIFDKSHFRLCLLYEFKLGHTAAHAHKNLSVVFGDQRASERTCRNWFAKFSSGDFSIDDERRSGRLCEFDSNKLLELVKVDSRQSTREMASKLGCSHDTIHQHLIKLGFVQKLGKWLPHHLTDEQKWQRLAICSSLLSRKVDREWIKQIVTGDEKWVLYVNHTRKRQWLPRDATPEPDIKGQLHPKKVMLSVFWDFKGVIWYELLTPGTTIDANVYSIQLQKLAEQVRIKRPEKPKVLLLHDNARPHVAKTTKNKLNQLGWETLPHAPYSPDLAPTDYHIFRSLSNFLREKSFDDVDNLKSDIDFFFQSKSTDFYAKGIFELPNRWSKVIESDGDYIKD